MIEYLLRLTKQINFVAYNQMQTSFELVEKRAFSSLCTGCTEMMGLIGAGNNPMVGMTVAVAVAIEEASKA